MWISSIFIVPMWLSDSTGEAALGISSGLFFVNLYQVFFKI